MASELGNDAFLSKIDSLRATNVGSMIPLPQAIVVGDQSSGKSSALESLTGFAFPRAVNLCTRYATQISCIRADEERISVSIIPRPDADEKLKTRLQGFHHVLDGIDSTKLAQVFEKANMAMGISIEEEDANSDAGYSAFGELRSPFSEDILKIDISGPTQVHLTVIDVPGIFRIPTPGLTTESDVLLVRNMVKKYMENPRTIILAVIPCNVDIATQEILKLAGEADPDGTRTMGVLTKPDLATERATQDVVLELIRGQRMPLKLGYCVIKNRSADDHGSSGAERLNAERAFFSAPPWSSLADSQCLGTDALRVRLRQLVLDISKRELPQVRAEIESRLRSSAARLEALGPPRADEIAQRQHLVKIAARVQEVTKSAVHGFYAGDDGLFQRHPELRLVTRLVAMNEEFADLFWHRGHTQHFRDEWDDDGESNLSGDHELFPAVDAAEYGELTSIIDTDFECPKPAKGPMTDLIRDLYHKSRGLEIGTFNSTVLPSILSRITERWEPLVLSYASKAIVAVHDYLFKLVHEVTADETVAQQIWDGFLCEELCERYQSIMDHARFLLKIERSCPPVTLNHYFNATLQKARQERLVDAFDEMGVNDSSGDNYVYLSELQARIKNMSNTQNVCEDILDAVESYYKVARKRFVDTVCQHLIYHFLLTGPQSPLRILTPERVLQLSADQLAAIAGEDSMTVHQRQVLERQVESLKAATKVLRS